MWPLLDQRLFTVILTGFCVLGQNDYYRIAESQGHLPARRTGIITTTLMMFALLFSARYAEAVIPIGSTLICCYLLFRQKPRIATIADLSTTLAGLFYGGFVARRKEIPWREALSSTASGKQSMAPAH